MSRGLAASTRLKKMKEQHWRCFYCATPLFDIPTEVDHIIARSLGGDGTTANQCITCRQCNRTKGSRTLPEFKRYVELKSPEKLIRGMFYYEFINIYPRG